MAHILKIYKINGLNHISSLVKDDYTACGLRISEVDKLQRGKVTCPQCIANIKNLTKNWKKYHK